MYIIKTRYKRNKKDLILYWGIQSRFVVDKKVNKEEIKNFVHTNYFSNLKLAQRKLENVPDRLFIEFDDAILLTSQIVSLGDI